MIGFLAIGAVVGIILGLRFKVLVLVPATLLATGVVTAVGLLDGQQLRVIALTAVAVAALLQVGYVVGCVVEVAAPWRAGQKIRSDDSRYRRPDTEPFVDDDVGATRTVSFRSKNFSRDVGREPYAYLSSASTISP